MQEFEEGRYITLDGRAIDANCQPEHWLRHEFNNTGNHATIALAALSKILYTESSFGIPLTASLLVKAPLKMGEHFMLKLHFGKAAPTTLCIDTRPDQKTVPVSQYAPAVHKMSRFHQINTAICGGIPIILTAQLSSFFPSATEYLLLCSSSAYAAGFSDSLNGAARFNKVAKGEWAIVNWPSPKKVTEEKKNEDHNLLPEMV